MNSQRPVVPHRLDQIDQRRLTGGVVIFRDLSYTWFVFDHVGQWKADSDGDLDRDHAVYAIQ